MEGLERRSSTRIRKPTAKLVESQSDSGSACVTLQENIQVDTDHADENAVNKALVRKTAKRKRNERTSSIRQGDARIKASFKSKETYIDTVKKEKADSSATVSETFELKSDDPIDEVDAEKSDEMIKTEYNFEGNVDSSLTAESCKEASFVQERVADNNDDVLKPVKKYAAQKPMLGDSTEEILKPAKEASVQETVVDNYNEDILKPVKKHTVQVCVRLKDMMLIPEIKKDMAEILEETTGEQRRFENDPKEGSKSKRRKLQSWDNYTKEISDQINVVKDSFKEHALGNIDVHNQIFKEDGSFVEAYESNTNCFKNNTRIKVEGFKGSREVSDIGELSEICEEDVDRSGRMTKDVDVLGEIESDDLDAADEEVSDFDEAGTEKSFQCHVCLKIYSSRCNLNKHLALHSDGKPFQCEICGMSFALKAYLKLHSVVHSGNRKHKCEICGKAFLRRTNLNAHMQSHTDVKAFSCDTCGKMFKTKLGRDAHMKEHGPELGYQCHKCGKSYSQKAYLIKHISIHAGVKPFKCLVCGKSFPYNQSLQEHTRTHTGEKPETCDICGKSFNNKRQLRKHTQYHNTVTPFSCKECNMFYDSQQSLNKHFTKSHNRKYGCDFCSKSFVNKKHLKAHQACDHKEHLAAVRKMPAENLAKAKKVSCSLCHRVFFNRYVLSKHLMSKHQLSEQDMKDLLNIRKKAVSKKPMDQYRSSNMEQDFDKVLENDKSFRVYYKDDDMAVYVKGTDNFDSRLKSIDEGNHAAVNDNVNDQKVRYIVLEDNELLNANENAEITYSEAASEVINLKDSVVERLCTGSGEKDSSASDLIESQVDNACISDQNYYVVFTEANENSGKMVEEIDSKIVSEAEIKTLSDDGAERIVLILNEGEDENNFMLESGEHYEIVADGTDFLHEGSRKEEDRYEIVATGPVTGTDNISEDTFETQGGSIIRTSNDVETLIVNTSKAVNSHNLPLLEQLQTHENGNEMKIEILNSENINNRETKKEHQNKMPDIIIDKLNVENEEIANVQYQRIPESKSANLEEEDHALIPAVENLKTDGVVSSNTTQETTYNKTETTDVGELLPKNTSAQEFANFENALKSKSGEFHNHDEYNKFLDKMIQSLQKAKQTGPK